MVIIMYVLTFDGALILIKFESCENPALTIGSEEQANSYAEHLDANGDMLLMSSP